MVRSTEDTLTKIQIDDALAAAFSDWHGVDDDAAEWDGWDDDSKLLYRQEWGMAEDRLGRLQAWADSGAMTAEQRTRFDELRQLVGRTRPILEKMAVGGRRR